MKTQWEKLPQWLRWGLTFLVLGALVIASIFIEGLKEGSAFDWIRVVLLMPFAFVTFWFGDQVIFGLVKQLALYFVVGSMLGWLFGKLKK